MGARWRCRPTSSTREQVDGARRPHGRHVRRLDILVNNAFRMDRGEPFESVDLDSLAQGLRRQRLGCARADAGVRAAPPRSARPIAATRRSCSSSRCRCARSAPNEGAYATSKAALRTAVQALALELGPGRVRVNAVAPGWIGGPNVEMFIDWESQNRDISRDDVRARSRRGSRSA